MKYLLAVFLLVLSFSFATQALADKQVRIQCGPDNGLKEKIERNHLERSISSAITKNGQLLLVLGTKDNSDWTILVYDIYGNVCVLLTGHNWSFYSEWELGT